MDKIILRFIAVDLGLDFHPVKHNLCGSRAMFVIAINVTQMACDVSMTTESRAECGFRKQPIFGYFSFRVFKHPAIPNPLLIIRCHSSRALLVEQRTPAPYNSLPLTTFNDARCSQQRNKDLGNKHLLGSLRTMWRLGSEGKRCRHLGMRPSS